MLFIIDSKERRKAAAEYVARLTSSPVHYVEIKPYKRNRSQAQNRTYWNILGAFSEYTGYTPDELHELFKFKFLGIERRSYLGDEVSIPVSTSILNTSQFSDYLNCIIALADIIALTLPLDDETNYAHHGSK